MSEYSTTTSLTTTIMFVYYCSTLLQYTFLLYYYPSPRYRCVSCIPDSQKTSVSVSSGRTTSINCGSSLKIPSSTSPCRFVSLAYTFPYLHTLSYKISDVLQVLRHYIQLTLPYLPPIDVSLHHWVVLPVPWMCVSLQLNHDIRHP